MKTVFDSILTILENPKEYERIKSSTATISEIDEKLEALENQRSILLCFRNQVVKEAAHTIEIFRYSNMRRIIHHSMD